MGYISALTYYCYLLLVSYAMHSYRNDAVARSALLVVFACLVGAVNVCSVCSRLPLLQRDRRLLAPTVRTRLRHQHGRRLLQYVAEQAGSMLRYGVRPSVCPSMGPQQQTRCCRVAAVEDQRRANASSATLSAYVGS